jgi:hypothetical protein
MATLAVDDSLSGPSAPPEPRPWWRLPSRIEWMLGFERSELEVQAFAGVIYAAAEGSAQRLPTMRGLAATLQNLRSRPDMPAAMACERLYYEALTDADRRAEIWSLRDRFARVATPDALAGFATTRIADIAAASGDDLIAEVRTLLSYTHKSYQLTLVRELAAARLKRWLLWWTVALMLLFGVALWTLSDAIGITAPRSLLLGVAALALAGGVGAVMSVARRLQGAIDTKVMSRDPLFEIAALELGRNGIMLSCLIGSVFALLVFGVFYGAVGALLGLNGGFLFPALSGRMLGHAPGIAHALGFKADGDLARMLIISFVAGFAERLVPDSIDRILSQGDKNK